MVKEASVMFEDMILRHMTDWQLHMIGKGFGWYKTRPVVNMFILMS